MLQHKTSTFSPPSPPPPPPPTPQVAMWHQEKAHTHNSTKSCRGKWSRRKWSTSDPAGLVHSPEKDVRPLPGEQSPRRGVRSPRRLDRAGRRRRHRPNSLNRNPPRPRASQPRRQEGQPPHQHKRPRRPRGGVRSLHLPLAGFTPRLLSLKLPRPAAKPRLRLQRPLARRRW